MLNCLTVFFVFFLIIVSISWRSMWRHVTRDNRNNIQSSLPLRIWEQCRLHMEYFGWARRHHCIGVHRLPAGGQIWLSGDQWHRSAINMVSKQTVTSTGSRTALSVLIFGTCHALRRTRDPQIMNLAWSIKKNHHLIGDERKHRGWSYSFHSRGSLERTPRWFLLALLFLSKLCKENELPSQLIPRIVLKTHCSILSTVHELFLLPNRCSVFFNLPLYTSFFFAGFFFYPASICRFNLHASFLSSCLMADQFWVPPQWEFCEATMAELH